jgi:hypothetical protein
MCDKAIECVGNYPLLALGTVVERNLFATQYTITCRDTIRCIRRKDQCRYIHGNHSLPVHDQPGIDVSIFAFNLLFGNSEAADRAPEPRENNTRHCEVAQHRSWDNSAQRLR